MALACAAVAGPDTEAHGPSQTAADLIREAAGSDVAFLAAGMLKSSFNPSDLSTLVRFPTDEIAILNLKGAQIKAALERSVALYPSPSDSFLQLSNVEATFAKNAEPDKRVVRVLIGGAPLDSGRTYTVAMPTSLARGGLGYFKVWDRNHLKTTLEKVTLESVLGGKSVRETAPRWRIQN